MPAAQALQQHYPHDAAGALAALQALASNAGPYSCHGKADVVLWVADFACAGSCVMLANAGRTAARTTTHQGLLKGSGDARSGVRMQPGTQGSMSEGGEHLQDPEDAAKRAFAVNVLLQLAGEQSAEATGEQTHPAGRV